MNIRTVSLRAPCAAALVLLAFPAHAQSNVPEPTPLVNTVSIGDVLQAQDAKLTATHVLTPNAPPILSPIHLIYVHGVNDVGPNDSAMVRKAICKYVHECTVTTDPPVYAEGPFALTAPVPNLTYLQQPIWATPEQWHASAPFILRYRISGGGHAPIVLDEINWYPLVYPLKCKFLLPGDVKLTGSIGSKQQVCMPPANQPDPDSPGRFLAYQWQGNVPLFTTDLPRQHATLINRALKIEVMDWGFADAVITLGPLREILTAAIRQLLVQAITDIVPATSRARGLAVQPAVSLSDDMVPVFFVTHSLGSYLTLTAMDSAWLGSTPTDIPGFDMTPAQTQAVDFLARHTVGFYFLANQIGLLELGRIAPPAPDAQPDCSRAATVAARTSSEPAAAALSHYGCMRHNYLSTHAAVPPASAIDPSGAAGQLANLGARPLADPRNTGPQIIA